MTNNFTIEGRAASVMQDIQRQFMFEISFPNVANLIADKTISTDLVEELTVRARSIQIPERGIEQISSFFGGMHQIFPGKPTFSNTFSINFEESENQNAYRIFYNWLQSIFDITKGYSNMIGKRPGNTPLGYVTDAVLQLKKYDGTFEKKIILFKNCFIQNVAAVDLDYTGGNDSVKYNATFAFDWFYLLDNIGDPIVTL